MFKPDCHVYWTKKTLRATALSQVLFTRKNEFNRKREVA